uniref:Uncharacterized protein n=1 Tax=Oryza punctata TaxID=4537 RepID=A0A0E0JJL2_ORYPU
MVATPPCRSGEAWAWTAGMQPSSIRPAATGEGGRRLSSEGEEKFIHTLPALIGPDISS